MHERKRKCSSLNTGETVLFKCPATENILYPFSKRPCFPAQNLVKDVGINNENSPSGQRINLTSYAIPKQNPNHRVMDTSTPGYFPYTDINYKPRLCRMCVAGDSGHINHILG